MALDILEKNGNVYLVLKCKGEWEFMLLNPPHFKVNEVEINGGILSLIPITT